MFHHRPPSSFERPERSSLSNERINLEVEALEGAVNAFIKTGFSTLSDGLPEHLLELLASFSKNVPENDERRQSVQELIKGSLYEANAQYQNRLRLLSHERREAHQEQLTDLLELVDNPREAERLVDMMKKNKGDDLYEQDVWQQATRFQSLSQDTPLVSAKRPGLRTLVKVEELLNNQDKTFSPDDAPFETSDPAMSTIRPLANVPHQHAQISERLTKR